MIRPAMNTRVSAVSRANVAAPLIAFRGVHHAFRARPVLEKLALRSRLEVAAFTHAGGLPKPPRP